MHTRSLLGIALLGASLGSCTTAEPARPQVVAPSVAPSLEQQTIELERASRPGPEHRRLDVLAGEWDVAMVSVDAQGRETELARGEGDLVWVLDGRFLSWSATLGIAGAPRTTTGYLGFDRRSRDYELLMISNLATGMEVATGRGDPERAGLRFTLEQFDAALSTRVRAISVLRLLTRDHFVLDQVSTDAGGRERVAQRHHYRRRAAGRGATTP